MENSTWILSSLCLCKFTSSALGSSYFFRRIFIPARAENRNRLFHSSLSPSCGGRWVAQHTHVGVNHTSLRAFLCLLSTPNILSGSFKQQLTKQLGLNAFVISNSPEMLRVLRLPIQVETGSYGAVEYGCQGDLRRREQQSRVGHGCLSQKVVSALPQRFWVLQRGEPCLR